MIKNKPCLAFIQGRLPRPIFGQCLAEQIRLPEVVLDASVFENDAFMQGRQLLRALFEILHAVAYPTHVYGPDARCAALQYVRHFAPDIFLPRADAFFQLPLVFV